MRPRSVLVLVVLLGAASTTASAHGAGDDAAGFFKAEADGLAVTLQSDHLVQKAQRDIVFNVTVYTNASGSYARATNLGVDVAVTGPAKAEATTTRTAEGHETRVRFPAPGEWLLLVQVNGTIRSFPIHVYPPSNVRLEANDFPANFHHAHMTVRETAYVVDDRTSLLVNATVPGMARVQHENGTGVPLFVELRPNDLGGLVFEHTFDEEARYLVFVKSPGHGIGYEDLPPLKLVIGPPFPGWTPQESPGPGVAATLALLAFLAFRGGRR